MEYVMDRCHIIEMQWILRKLGAQLKILLKLSAG